MKLREALIVQSPSLALQRAAADEIAALDQQIKYLEETLNDYVKRTSLAECELATIHQNYRNYIKKVYGDDYGS